MLSLTQSWRILLKTVPLDTQQDSHATCPFELVLAGGGGGDKFYNWWHLTLSREDRRLEDKHICALMSLAVTYSALDNGGQHNQCWCPLITLQGFAQAEGLDGGSKMRRERERENI